MINRFQINNATIPLHYEFSVFDGHTNEINDDVDVMCKVSMQ